ncbi:hypothetical protein, partial [Escherichia coli]|uniref:hypothetical protein n=1 Tax=Escherichia coli TaxID=562 RepID=UPI00200ECD99
NQQYFEQYVPGDDNQSGFFCFNTDREEGMKKISELANSNEAVRTAIAQEIFRKFMGHDFSICTEDDVYTKECVEGVGILEERLLSDDPLIDK